jgi:hypothetical protein
MPKILLLLLLLLFILYFNFREEIIFYLAILITFLGNKKKQNRYVCNLFLVNNMKK